MRKDPNSIRSLGHTVIHTDQPLKADLKAQANARGLTLVAYLRQLADTAAAQPVQTNGWQGAPGVPLSESNHALMRVVDNLSAFVAVKIADSIQFCGDTEEDLDRHIQLLTSAVNAKYAQSRLAGAKELLRIKQEQIAQRDQVALPLAINLEKGGAGA